ncbi:MAG: hypothetical protein ABIA92_01355 [Patescibacteria group bacterium]
MRSILLTIVRITIIFICTVAISFALIAFLRAHIELDSSISSINFIWQIVLLGFVAGAAMFTIPKSNALSTRQTQNLFLSGCCTTASSAIILIGFCIIFMGAEWQLPLIQNTGGLIADSGIVLMCWGISMAALELIGVIFAAARKFYQ